ncbi:MAG: hypothetical protein KAU83_05150 [Bacteroidales bacterium]|nr:hypothetical protein [Bacteroidales bacterium]
MNFAVPDLPALKGLGAEPSTILRPSTPEVFSFITSNFFSDEKIVIPNSFAAEFAPFILANSHKMTLQKYQKNPELYSLRISVGSFKDTSNISNLSVGIRITVIDKGDLKNDKQFLEKLTSILRQRVKKMDYFRDEYQRINNISEEDFAENKNGVQEIIKEYATSKIKEDTDKHIEQLKEKYKTENWNSEKFDIAFAVVGTSSDSIVKNTKFNSFITWLTYGYPMFENSGQVLVGGNLRVFKGYNNDKYYVEPSLGSRVYLGTNRIKGFSEVQYTYNQYEGKSHFLLDVGGEFNISDGIWLDFYVGIDRNPASNVSEFISNFNFRYTLPEKFKFF